MYDECCACTTGNRTVSRRGYLFTRQNIGVVYHLHWSVVFKVYFTYIYLEFKVSPSNKPVASDVFMEFASFGQADVHARQEVTMCMTNVAHARQEIGPFRAEVTYWPART